MKSNVVLEKYLQQARMKLAEYELVAFGSFALPHDAYRTAAWIAACVRTGK